MSAIFDRPLILLDYETTGLSPNEGDRAIEIGAVRISPDGEIIDRFQTLLNPGFRVSSFISSFTTISNEMLSSAPTCEQGHVDFCDWMDDDQANIIAHNASFDSKFFNMETENIGYTHKGDFVCSLLLARRIANAPSNKLGDLIDFFGIKSQGTFHRALYDAEMTAQVWSKLMQIIKNESGLDAVSIETIKKLNDSPKKNVKKILTQLA
jgi:DNA polymerase-3 subunit epsilon